MGFDLYAGPMSRYCGRDWEMYTVGLARSIGLQVDVEYDPERAAPLTRQDAIQGVSDYKTRVNRKRAKQNRPPIDWIDDPDGPYWTRKPGYEGKNALTLWAAHIKYPHVPLPKVLPDPYDSDPAYVLTVKSREIDDVFALESHLFLPCKDDFIFSEPDPMGTERFTTSLKVLRDALEYVNDRSWRADAQQRADWLHRDLPISKKLEYLTVHSNNVDEPLRAVITGIRDVELPEDPFQHAAQFGFAVYYAALEFAEEHGVPVITDG